MRPGYRFGLEERLRLVVFETVLGLLGFVIVCYLTIEYEKKEKRGRRVFADGASVLSV